MTTLTHEHGFELAAAQRLAQALANTTKVPTYRPVANDPPGEPNPLGDEEGDSEPPDRARAVTLTSIAIDQTLQRNRICADPDCQGPHYTWQCPAIHTRLFASDTPLYDTNELAQLWATSRTLLAAKLAMLTRAQLHMQAVAFAAWLDTRTHAGLNAASVLHIWETFICAGGDPAEMTQKAAA